MYKFQTAVFLISSKEGCILFPKDITVLLFKIPIYLIVRSLAYICRGLVLSRRFLGAKSVILMDRELECKEATKEKSNYAKYKNAASE